MSRVPKHLAIIIDGNRRWAKKRGLTSFEGHKKGLENVEKIGDWAKKRGIKILTLYVFSVENWQRKKKEVNYLMKLLSRAFSGKNIKKLLQKGIKMQVIGQKERLPKALQEQIKKAEDLTKNNKEGILNLAISYGGRSEIVQAIKKIVKKKIPAEKIDEDLINQELWTAGLAEPDLIIRTGGEQRLSNFLTWQSIYSEFYFTKKNWPEFSEQDLDEALKDFSLRQRRFGK
jgi:undecaprenyl diphosphate synthase